MKDFIILSIGFLILSCTSKEPEPFELSRNLIGVKSSFIGELGDDSYFRHESKVKNKEIKTKYVDDIILITTWYKVNACGNYYGNLEFNGDTISLKYLEKPRDLCSSVRIDKLTYIVDNTKRKKWIIKR